MQARFKTVQTVAVLGARAVGARIALAAALGGCQTVLEDMSAARLEGAMAWVRQFLAEKIAQGEMSPAGRDAALARITPARTVEAACREADLVLEALPEDIELKIEIFALLDRLGKPGAIFASASSSFAVADMTAMTVCADRCVGMRFAGAEMKRLEIVRGPQTSEQTMEACREVGRRMQMEVTVLDEPVSAGN